MGQATHVFLQCAFVINYVIGPAANSMLYLQSSASRHVWIRDYILCGTVQLLFMNGTYTRFELSRE